ncbi:MAG: MraY family glycosyltransferase [Planctomycetota bacterium]
MTQFPIPLAVGFFLSAATMPLFIAAARRFGIVDAPAHRKTHTTPTPYLGGLGIVLGIVLGPLICATIFKIPLMFVEVDRYWMIVGPALPAAMLGLVDDARSVRARTKLIVQIVIVFIFVWAGFKIELIEFPGVRGYPLFHFESIPFTMGWMLAVINGVNLVDGIDGLGGSVTAVIYAVIATMALCLEDPDWLVAGIALSALGATLGFLMYNWKPAKIYMGDAGSLASGMLIATLLVAMGQHRIGGAILEKEGDVLLRPYSYQFAKITLIAFYPIMEISLSILRRLLSGKPIGSADKGHVHHRLMRWGWSAPMVCLAAMLICAIAGSTVLFAQLRYHGVTSWLLLAGGILFVLLLHYSGFLENFQPQSIRGSRPHFLIANHFISMQRIKLELAHSIGEVMALTEQTCVEFGVQKYCMRLAPSGKDAGPFELEWSKPALAHASFLVIESTAEDAVPVGAFSDKVGVASGSAAEWTFEPHVVEEEIDVEYRVLMSDFMQKALGCAEYLYVKRTPVPLASDGQGESSTNVRSSELRRRKRHSEKIGEVPQSPPELAAGEATGPEV